MSRGAVSESRSPCHLSAEGVVEDGTIEKVMEQGGSLSSCAGMGVAGAEESRVAHASPADTCTYLTIIGTGGLGLATIVSMTAISLPPVSVER